MVTRSPVHALMIAGMPRSGTTLLQRVCNNHPQMWITSEFGNYAFVGDPLPIYALRTARRIWQIDGRRPILGSFGHPSVTSMGPLRRRGTIYLENVRAAAGHLLGLTHHGRGRVTLAALVAEASRNRPHVRIVGDKFPYYIFKLGRYVGLPELLRLVIYRDCRDVTSSYLRKIRNDWKGRRWVSRMDTAEKVALRWVQAIEVMERNAEHLFMIRYEDLVSNPRSELNRLAEWLDVDPSGFDASRVHETSVGKYKRGLTGPELDDVLRVAGSALERLRYPLD